MNIDWVIPCRFVEVHDNLATIVGGGIDTFWLNELPGPVQVMLAVRLTGMVEEFDPSVQRTLRNQVRDPRGGVVSESAAHVAFGGQSARPEWLVGVTLPLAVVFEAAEEGSFAIEIAVDDASESLPIHVVQGELPGAPPTLR